MVQQVQIKTTINKDKIASGSPEARFLEASERMPGSKSANYRDMFLVGFLMRELGISQQLLDLETSGKLTCLTLMEKRQMIAKYLLLEGQIKEESSAATDGYAVLSVQKSDLPSEPKAESDPESISPVDIRNWSGLGS